MLMRIRELRKRTGIKGIKMAEILGCSSPQYYDMENEKKRIHAENLRIIATTLGVKVDDLYISDLPIPDDPKYDELECVKMVEGYEAKGLTREKIRQILDGVLAALEGDLKK